MTPIRSLRAVACVVVLAALALALQVAAAAAAPVSLTTHIVADQLPSGWSRNGSSYLVSKRPGIFLAFEEVPLPDGSPLSERDTVLMVAKMFAAQPKFKQVAQGSTTVLGARGYFARFQMQQKKVLLSLTVELRFDTAANTGYIVVWGAEAGSYGAARHKVDAALRQVHVVSDAPALPPPTAAPVG